MLRGVFRTAPLQTIPRASNQRLVARFSRFYSEKAEKATEDDAGAANASESAAPDSNPELTALQEKFNAKDKECAKFKSSYQRAVADFQNLQKTTEVEKKKAKDFALQGFAKDLLATVDNFDLALKAVSEEALAKEEFKNFHDGVKMVQNVFEKTLERNGLVKTNPLGEKFDPNVHEAIFMVPMPDKEPGTVFDVQQTGFIYNDRVIRAPKVGVVKNQ